MSRIFFRRANLIDGINPPKKEATIVIQNERIAAVYVGSDSPKSAANDIVYDLEGRALMPGMIESHCHLGYDNVKDFLEVPLKHSPTMATLVAARHAETLLRAGFTGAVGAGIVHNIDVTLRDAINSGLIPGPRLMACSCDIGTTGDSIDFIPSWWKLGVEGTNHICDTPEEFRKAVRTEIKKGVDIVKLFPTGGHGFPAPANAKFMTVEEMRAAADAAHERGKKIRGHIVSKRGIIAALDAGFDVIDHGDMMDDECIERLVKQNAFVTPSLYFPYMAIEHKRLTGEQPFGDTTEMEIGLEQSRRYLARAHKAGVRLLVGDDFGTFAMPHGDQAKELEAYVKAVGIPPLDVITWATRNGAELLGMKNDLGTIEAGKLADLLIVNGDPLKDVTVLQDRANLAVVMKGGKFVECQLAPSIATDKAA